MESRKSDSWHFAASVSLLTIAESLPVKLRAIQRGAHDMGNWIQLSMTVQNFFLFGKFFIDVKTLFYQSHIRERFFLPPHRRQYPPYDSVVRCAVTSLQYLHDFCMISWSSDLLGRCPADSGYEVGYVIFV